MQMIAEIERPRDACLEEVEWYLCGAITEGDRTRESVISKPRFRVGRRSACDLRVAWSTVSGVHAEFVKTASTLFLRDLGSTNGTFVNGRQIKSDTVLSEGDVIQFGGAEFRIRCRDEDNGRGTVHWSGRELTSRLIAFEKLVSGKGLIPHYQPIVKLADVSTVGFEVLARSQMPEFPTPREMFDTAAQLDREHDLSEASRIVGVRNGLDMPHGQTLYLNTHPMELQGDRLIRSLELLLPTSQSVSKFTRPPSPT